MDFFRNTLVNLGRVLGRAVNLISGFAVVVCFIFASCKKDNASGIENEAMVSMVAYMKERTFDEAAARGKHTRKVFSNDSLCIIHTQTTIKGTHNIKSLHQMQYIYLKSCGKNYECLTKLDKDSVFKTIDQLDDIKIHTMYRGLTYEGALFVRAARYIMKYGRIAGTRKKKDFHIPIPLHTGHWFLRPHKDIDGNPDTTNYLNLNGEGFFCNEFTSKAKLTALLVIDKQKAGIKLLEYGKKPVVLNGRMRLTIKDSEGDVHEVTLEDVHDEHIYFSHSSFDFIKLLLEKEGTIHMHAIYETRNSANDDYQFKFDADGYNEALKYLK